MHGNQWIFDHMQFKKPEMCKDNKNYIRGYHLKGGKT